MAKSKVCQPTPVSPTCMPSMKEYSRPKPVFNRLHHDISEASTYNTMHKIAYNDKI